MRWPSKDPDDYDDVRPWFGRTRSPDAIPPRRWLVASLAGTAAGFALALLTGGWSAIWVGTFGAQLLADGHWRLTRRRRARGAA